MANQDYIFIPNLLTVQFSVEPALTAWDSLSLLNHNDQLSGLNPWIYEAARGIPQAHKRESDLLLRYVWMTNLPPLTGGQTFVEWLNRVAALDPQALREHSLKTMANRSEEYTGEQVTAEELLTNRERFMSISEKYCDHKKEKGMVYDAALADEAFQLYQQPEQIIRRLVAEMRWMWENVLEAEWNRAQPTLVQSMEAYTQMEYPEMTPIEAVRVVTGRDISNLQWDKWGEKIVFVPSPHIGPYISHYLDDAEPVSYVMFGVRLPKGSRYQSPALTRSELHVRLDALADDTRLRILEAVAQQSELCAQDIITQLDITQSAASRNLRQLVATGFLIERVQGNAKCYTINRERFEDTLRALRRFVRTASPNWLAI